MFTYPGTSTPDFRLLRNISRIEAGLFAGGSEWLLNRIGSAITLGNPRIMHALYGKVVEMEHPVALKNWLIDKFVKTMGVTTEALDGRDPHSFPSLQKLFLRDIDMSKRPLAAEPLVSPVDGFLKGEGQIRNGLIPQNIKGEHFTVAEFINDHKKAEIFSGGHWHNLYLSPADYHHVHASMSGYVTSVEYIPGTLWPVNQWSHEHRKNLYGQQERLVLHIDSDDFGKVAFVMVGATTVGGMYLTFDPGVKPPIWSKDRNKTIETEYYEPVRIEKGERIGTFRLGSTVVMLFEPGRIESKLPQFELDSSVLRIQVNESMANRSEQDEH